MQQRGISDQFEGTAFDGSVLKISLQEASEN